MVSPLLGRYYATTEDAIRAPSELTSYVHGDYRYNKTDWDTIRDCIAGERRIKDKGELYLPRLDAEYGTVYEDYKTRASYVNMVNRTIQGLVGTIFRRPVKVDGVKKEDLKNVTNDGLSFNLFAKKLAFEVAGIGRVGVLVDMTDEKPYFTEYVAENILSWRTARIKDRTVLQYVLLREIVDETPDFDSATSTPNYTGSLRARYRVLLLDDGVYRQRVYDTDRDGKLTGQYKTVTPTKNGKPFDFIPMVIFGPMSPTPDVQKSPVLDIAVLNLAHYRTSAQLEHGRYYTALPVYYTQVGAGEDKGEYHVGPSVVWEVPPDSKPGILEYYGHGLKTLADSLLEKEEHISQLGGRVMGIRPQAVSQSDNIYKMKQANELSILLNITESMSEGLTTVLIWYLDWQRKPIKDVRVHLNQDFKALNIGARELRAIAVLYQSGMLPISEVYRVLQETEFIGEEVTLEEFREMLDDLNNFPHQPDVEAMHEGFPDADARLRRQMADDQMEFQEDMNELTFEQGEKTAQFEAEQAERLAQQQHKRDKDMSTHQTKNDIKKDKAKPKPKPAAKKPAAKKPKA